MGKKACDMTPHSWIVDYLYMFGVAVNIKNLLFNSMENLWGKFMGRIWLRGLTCCD